MPHPKIDEPSLPMLNRRLPALETSLVAIGCSQSRTGSQGRSQSKKQAYRCSIDAYQPVETSLVAISCSQSRKGSQGHSPSRNSQAYRCSMGAYQPVETSLVAISCSQSRRRSQNAAKARRPSLPMLNRRLPACGNQSGSNQLQPKQKRKSRPQPK